MNYARGGGVPLTKFLDKMLPVDHSVWILWAHWECAQGLGATLGQVCLRHQHRGQVPPEAGGKGAEEGIYTVLVHERLRHPVSAQ